MAADVESLAGTDCGCLTHRACRCAKTSHLVLLKVSPDPQCPNRLESNLRQQLGCDIFQVKHAETQKGFRGELPSTQSFKAMNLKRDSRWIAEFQDFSMGKWPTISLTSVGPSSSSTWKRQQVALDGLRNVPELNGQDLQNAWVLWPKVSKPFNPGGVQYRVFQPIFERTDW